MTLTEQAPGDTETKPAKPADPPAPTGPTVRNMLAAGGGALALVAGIVAFVAGGWWVLGGVAVAGVAGTAAVAKARSTRPHKTRPGLFATWLGRPRRTTTTRTATKGLGSLPWPLTGSQSKRARSGRGTGRGPAVTAKGRARRAAQAVSGKAPGKKSAAAARPVAAKRPGARPAGPGTSRQKTPTKSPEKLSNRPRRTPAAKTPTKPASNGTARPRLAAAKKTPARPAGGISNGGKGAKIIPFRRPIKKTSTPPAATPRRSSGVSARRNAGSRPGAQSRIKKALGGTSGGKRLGGRRTSTGLSSRAKRLATPRARYSKGRDLAVPKRTPRAPHRKPPATRRHLIRTALRIPARTSRWRWRRPSKQAQTRAKRTLWRRGRIAGRRALTWPLRAARRSWAARKPLPFWPTLPTPIQQSWLVPTIPDPQLTTERPPHTRKHRAPYPVKTARRATEAPQPVTVKGTLMNNPVETIVEAFSQITSFDPENAREIEAFLADLHRIPAELATALSGLAEQWRDNQPLDAAVPEAVSQVVTLLQGSADVAEEANTTFRSVHENELSRLDDPRANEKAWDVTQNQ